MLIPLLVNLGMLGDSDDAAYDLWYVDAGQAFSRHAVVGMGAMPAVASQSRSNSADAQEARPE